MAFTLPLRRYFPRTISDSIAFLFLLGSIHGIALFELFHVLPMIYSNPAHASSGGYNLYYFHVFMGVYIYTNVMLNLYKVIKTNTTIRGKVLPSMLKPGGWHFCVVCESNVPPRSYHCHICNICILRRDHHCIFTGNCVGLYNFRYYVGLLFFMSMAAAYSCLLNLDFLYHLFGTLSIKNILAITFPLISWVFAPNENISGLEVFMSSLCLVGFCLSTGLAFYHISNSYHGQSVHERSYNVHKYDLGWKENLGLSFGVNWKYAWLFPLIPSPIPSDGLDFITKEQYESLKTM